MMNCNSSLLNSLEHDGIAVIPNVLQKGIINELIIELEAAIQKDKILYPNVFDRGMIHNCMSRGKNMAKLLDNSVMNAYLSKCFSDTAIIYAYQSSSLNPNSGNYGSRIHVDCPRFIENYYTNMGVIWPLTNFTEDNGATYYLPGSHKLENLPNENFFYKNCKRALANAGDMILLNSRLVHAAGINKTKDVRHALTINFCRSFMRQRFDFVRLLSNETMALLGEDGKRLIGMNVRMPTSLDEFYLPPDKRLYKANQG